MSSNLDLSCIEILPSLPAIGSVIWMHGLGANGNDFVPLVPELNLPPSLALRFIFPNAPQRPVTVNNGYVMPAWYDITSLGMNQHIDYDGMKKSEQQIQHIIQQEENLGIPAEKIVLAGFSQGAVMALFTGIHFSKRLAGIMALSGYLPFTRETLAAQQSKNQATSLFVGHGTGDNVVPYQAGLMAYDTLQSAGFKAQWHSYTMAHSVSGQEIRDISVWLQEIFK